MREPKPITRIEVTEGNRKLRIVLIVVLLVIGAVALTSGFMSLLGKDAGWKNVEVSNAEADYSKEILLQYNFSGTGSQTTALYKRISAVYSEQPRLRHRGVPGISPYDSAYPGGNNHGYSQRRARR